MVKSSFFYIVKIPQTVNLEIKSVDGHIEIMSSSNLLSFNTILQFLMHFDDKTEFCIPTNLIMISHLTLGEQYALCKGNKKTHILV